MRICVISPPAIEARDDTYSGNERVAYLTARELAEDHETTLIAPCGSKKGKYELFETISAGYGNSEQEQYNKYKDFILSKDWDLIITNEHFCPAAELLRERRFNLHWWIHDVYPMDRPPRGVKLVARSRWHAGYLSDRWATDVSYFPNPLDISHYSFKEDKDDYILFLNRMNWYKGPLAFIELCESLGVRGVLAGEDTEARGIELAIVKNIIRRVNADRNLEYHGRVDEEMKLELLSNASALVLPLLDPYMGAFELVVAEALASGTPVFTTDRGTPKEILGGIGVTGVGYVGRDINELREALRKFLERELRFDAYRCRERALSFDSKQLIKKYLFMKL